MVRFGSSIFSTALTVLAVLGVTGVNAACTTNLLVDDFTSYGSHLNKLGQWTSDDGSMTSISASSTTKTLSFTPKSSSYFYTTFTCLAASTDKYSAITFPFKGPAGASFTLELQSSSGGCSSSSYQSFYKTITGLTGSTQTITVPLSGFTGANLAAIKAFVWESFSVTSGTWQLGSIQMVCAATSSSAVSTTLVTSTKSSTTSVAVTSSTSVTSSSSTSVPVTSSTSTSTTSVAVTTTTTSTAATGTCTAPLLIDDWASQSRLTFLFYNAMLEPSSDDGTMTSIVVSNNHVTLTPKSGSYFYSNLGCIKATNKYGGVSLRIKAAAGTTFTVQFQSSATCSTDTFNSYDRTTTQLGWTFDGTEKLYNIPLSSFTGLDKDHITSILFYNFNNKAVTLGPMAFYCGTTVTEYVATTSVVTEPTSTVPLTSATPTSFVIDTFGNADTNNLGLWHGYDDGMTVTYSGGKVTIKSTDTDYSWYSSIGNECRDMTSYENAYLHIVYSGSNKFTIALQQHNSACDSSKAPFPETWDDVDASRYAVSSTEIFVPLAHFNIDKHRVASLALKAFTTTTSTVISKIEILNQIPTAQQSTVKIPSKLPTAPLVFACTRPNSFAFAIDDGIPEFAQQVMQIIKEEGIKVTFFTVGAALLDTSTNLSNVYKEMYSLGHQVALHSFTHPKMESLPTLADIDWEIQNDINAVSSTLGISSKYFRPPFGNEGARMRQRLAAKIPGSKLINWSVDVEDWLWASSSTPEKQLEAFQRDVNKGGNLVVMHYLSSSTVGYLRQFIQIAKATGKQLMRVDQCLSDPSAPPL